MSTARKTFTITALHIAMFLALQIKWEEAPYNGGAVVDKRKPFGDASLTDVIAPMLDIAQLEDDKGKKHWPAGTMAKVLAAYRELEPALQVCLSAQSFAPGVYDCGEDGRWKALQNRLL